MRGRYAHLARLTTAVGLYEHALGTAPRVASGMCVDDVARALVVVARDPDPDAAAVAMSRIYLSYLLRAQVADGSMHNRSDSEGRWLDEPSTGDHWGRALWALGTAVAWSPDLRVAAGALVGAQRAMAARSPHPRAMAYAALGAVQVMAATPDDLTVRRLLHDVRLALPCSAVRSASGTATGAQWGALSAAQPAAAPAWMWPYDRLTYANAVLPEAMIAVGLALHDDLLRGDGLELLAWLVAEQSIDGHLSVVPAHGRSASDGRPGFDQQPIEVAALAEAAATALAATHDVRWSRLLRTCLGWFEGDNDGGLRMHDAASGGAFDGLEDGSVNINQGAESTLAWLGTSQLAREVADDVVSAGR